MNADQELLSIGALGFRFLLDGDDTGGRMVMFEVTVPPGARVPAPHYHVSVDEVIYGLSGETTFYVNGRAHAITAGASCFIPRGIDHGFINDQPETARFLAVLTPASIGPAYFREMAALVNAGGPPDAAKMSEIMLRHGLHPVKVGAP